MEDQITVSLGKDEIRNLLFPKEQSSFGGGITKDHKRWFYGLVIFTACALCFLWVKMDDNRDHIDEVVVKAELGINANKDSIENLEETTGKEFELVNRRFETVEGSVGKIGRRSYRNTKKLNSFEQAYNASKKEVKAELRSFDDRLKEQKLKTSTEFSFEMKLPPGASIRAGKNILAKPTKKGYVSLSYRD